jgi:hypothetical protein
LKAQTGWSFETDHPGRALLTVNGASTPPILGGDYSLNSTFARRALIIPWILLAILALAPTAVFAQQTETPKVTTEELKKDDAQKQTDEAQPKTEEDPKLTPVPGSKALGMSILGNQEAPKALVIVPWKSSELGNGPSVSTLLDDSRLPVDKEVFMRMLSYYEIRSETARPTGATTNAAAPANAAQRRK